MIPIERTDEPSRLQHQALVQRAQAGGIDHYFLGDSITRRWAASEPEYADLRTLWDKTFAPQAVANFGWGGDTLENILWRIQNGELEGVHPQTVCLMAGTNNLPGGDSPDQVAEKTAKLIDAIHTLAPDAKLILTAIFPRFDDPKLGAKIPTINALIANHPVDRFIDLTPEIDNPAFYPDGLHPGLQVYEIWADHLISAIETLSPPRRPLS